MKKPSAGRQGEGKRTPSSSTTAKTAKAIKAAVKAGAGQLDPEWQRLAERLENIRETLADRKKRPLIVNSFEKDGVRQTVARKQSDPIALKTVIKVEKRRAGSRLAEDLEWIRAVWPKTVGADIAAETEVFAFKKGVLTISVFSSTLNQEILQFHKDAILQDLRDVWRASIPLLRVEYQPGGKPCKNPKTR